MFSQRCFWNIKLPEQVQMISRAKQTASGICFWPNKQLLSVNCFQNERGRTQMYVSDQTNSCYQWTVSRMSVAEHKCLFLTKQTPAISELFPEWAWPNTNVCFWPNKQLLSVNCFQNERGRTQMYVSDQTNSCYQWTVFRMSVAEYKCMFLTKQTAATSELFSEWAWANTNVCFWPNKQLLPSNCFQNERGRIQMYVSDQTNSCYQWTVFRMSVAEHKCMFLTKQTGACYISTASYSVLYYYRFNFDSYNHVHINRSVECLLFLLIT
jgi:hypothetical protein